MHRLISTTILLFVSCKYLVHICKTTNAGHVFLSVDVTADNLDVPPHADIQEPHRSLNSDAAL